MDTSVRSNCIALAEAECSKRMGSSNRVDE